MSTKMLYRGADVDVGNPRRPFSEQSAKLLYRSLKDVEAAMNDEELRWRICVNRYHEGLWKRG